MCYYCTIAGIKFEDNIGMAGAAIQVVQSVDFTGKHLIGDHNYAYLAGGFMYISLSSASIIDGTFTWNGFDFSYAGAFYIDNSVVTIHSSVVRLSAVSAIAVTGYGNFTLISCLIEDNTSIQYGAGLFLVNPVSMDGTLLPLYLSMYHTIFKNNICYIDGNQIQ
jgi:hypothetical protein